MILRLLPTARRAAERFTRRHAWLSAEDVEQDAVAGMIAAIDNFDPHGMLSITERAFYGALDASRESVKRQYRALRNDQLKLEPSTSPPEQDEVDYADAGERVRAMIGSLPTLQMCRVMYLRYCGGLTQEAIAARVGVTPPRVRAVITESLALLRRARRAERRRRREE